MKTLICKSARNLLLKSAMAALTALFSLNAAAQPTPEEMEELVAYSQCIRANGYTEFPDPGPDGLQIRITNPVAMEQFRAAQSACTDKIPSGMAAAMNAPMTPERLDTLVKFAECMRAAGLSDFPDPTPQGAFELSNPSFDLRAPQTQQTMNTCREANAVTGLMIRRKP